MESTMMEKDFKKISNIKKITHINSNQEITKNISKKKTTKTVTNVTIVSWTCEVWTKDNIY